MKSAHIVVAANFTAEPLARGLTFWSDTLHLGLEPTFAPYDQVFQQLIAPASETRLNRDGANVILVKLDRYIDDSRDRTRFLAIVRELADAMRTAVVDASVPFVVMACPPPPAVLSDAVAATLAREGEELLRSLLPAVSNVAFVASADVLEHLDGAAYHDTETEAIGDIPYTEGCFAAMATLIARRVRAMRGAQHKVVVLDCDNTLWGGVVGEVGADGVEIDAAHRELQEFVVAQHDAGMLVCLCSKNNEADVEEVFRTRGDMRLTWDHVTRSRINWEPKSQNLRALADELHLGLDSFVFIDDSPYEVAEVRQNAPEVVALQLPERPADFSRLLKNAWCFDRTTVTDADRVRAESYRSNLRRDDALKRAGSLDDFLRELQLEVEITAPSCDELPRASQMTQRTNQFNLSTVRRSEAELRAALQSGELDARIVSVRDRFGDYGIVGLMLFAIRADHLHVDTFLLSCRVLGRRVEYHMLAALGSAAREHGVARVELPFLKSARNQPVLTFLNSLGTTEERTAADHRFVVDATAAVNAPTMRVSEMASAPDDDVQPPAAGQVAPGPASARVLSRIAEDWSTTADVVAAIRVSQRRMTPASVKVAQVAPATDAEAAMAELWKRVLHVDAVGVTDNFFDLGGDSVAAVALFAQLRKRYDATLAPTLLLEAGTIRDLVARIGIRRQGAQLTTLIPIQPNGSRTPIFGLHAGMGTVMFYVALAKALGSEQPFYAFQSQGLYDDHPAHATIPEMARHYIAEMRTVQPAGPYRLVGFCLGATIAYEMARQLNDAGERVSLLASFDGIAPWFKPRGDAWSAAPKQGVGRLLHRARTQFFNRRNQFLRAYMQRRGGPVPRLFKKFDSYIQVNNHMAKTSYVPTLRIPGDVHVFTVKGRYPQPSLGWERYVKGNVLVQEIPGELNAHRDLMDPPMVGDLARRLATLL